MASVSKKLDMAKHLQSEKIPRKDSLGGKSTTAKPKKIYAHTTLPEEVPDIKKVSEILDKAVVFRERKLEPFWNKKSENTAEKLWLPSESYANKSILSATKKSVANTKLGKAWFSIEEKHPLVKNEKMTSFSLPQFSLPKSLEKDETGDGEKLRTLKMRIMPTPEQKKELDVMFNQFRWYYNMCLTLLRREGKDKEKITFITARDDILRKYRYEETTDENFRIIDIVKETDKNYRQTITPPWWEKKEGNEVLHSRIPYSALKSLISSISSSVSNRKGKDFEMKYATKKGNTETLPFDDAEFPSSIRKIKSKYWYRFKHKHGKSRKWISFAEIWKQTKHRPVTVTHEKDNDAYFLFYPVDRDWFPNGDCRVDNQNTTLNGNRVISIDQGIRKFFVGYDPAGKSVVVGNEASEKLKEKIKAMDGNGTFEDKRRIKNMVKDIHWKASKYLTSNYDTILLPEFNVSQIVRGKKLRKITKRLMLMFCFYEFKQRLKYKCECHGKKLIVVDESFTSRTCGKCGRLNDIGGCEEYHCVNCGLRGDRDILASRNIFIKNTLYKDA